MSAFSNRPKRVAIYARVSTAAQTVENQFQELREVAQRNGWQVIAELSDNGISGAKGRDQRPAFDQLLKRATCREFDLIMVWAIDRIGRSVQTLVTFINNIKVTGSTCIFTNRLWTLLHILGK